MVKRMPMAWLALMPLVMRDLNFLAFCRLGASG